MIVLLVWYFIGFVTCVAMPTYLDGRLTVADLVRALGGGLLGPVVMIAFIGMICVDIIDKHGSIVLFTVKKRGLR